MGNQPSTTKAKQAWLAKNIDPKTHKLNLMQHEVTDDILISICNFMQSFKGDEKGKRAIRDLELTSNLLTPKGICFLFNFMKEDKNITSLGIAYNCCDDTCMKSLGEMLSMNDTLVDLCVGGEVYDESAKTLPTSIITDAGIKELSTSLKSNKTLDRIRFCSAKITSECIPYMCEIMEKTKVSKITFTQESLSKDQRLVKFILKNSLERDPILLDLNELGIQDEDMDYIMQLMKKHGNNLEVVNFDGNLLTSKGITMLYDGLIEMKKVRVVRVSGNDISDDCMQSVANFIKQSPTSNLSIDLIGVSNNTEEWYDEFESYKEYTSNNKVTDKSIEILHSVLIGNINVKDINLGYQVGITDESVTLLKEIAEKSSAFVDLTWTSISEENNAELQTMFAVPVDKRPIPVPSTDKSASKSALSN